MKKTFALRSINFAAIFIKPRQWSPRSNTAGFHFTNSRAREKRSSASRGSCTFTGTSSIVSLYPKSISPSSAAKVFMFAPTPRHRRGSRLRRPSLFAPTSEIWATSTSLARSTVDEIKNAEPSEICRARAFVAASFTDAGSVREMTKLQ